MFCVSRAVGIWMCCVDNRADVTVDMADTLNVHRGGAPLVVGIRVGVGGVV